MRTTTVWVEKVNYPDNGDNCCYDACFSPEGNQLIAAVGQRILVINVAEGSIVQTLKGHKSTVYCVAYAQDGKRFASGGADKNVIIWSDTLQGTLKYVHGESIQCLAFNPTTTLLASCAVNDFGIWSPDKKSVDKHKVPSKINACSWTADGSYLALALQNGQVSIRKKSGSEHTRIERPGGALSPVWGVCWGKIPEGADGGQDMLCVVDWGQTLSFYGLGGKPIMKERQLGFDPLRVVYAQSHRDCEYIIVTGSNKALAVYTQEGVKVTQVAEQESWVWACAMKPNSHSLIVGTQQGILTYYDVQLLVVHALYKSLYAYRMNMTDVMVQNLLKDVRVRIKCRDVVKKLAIFKDSLAIQFADRVLIYQRETSSKTPSAGSPASPDDLKYHLRDKISHSFECSLLVMCTENLILCQEKKLQCYSFSGMRQKEWLLDSHIRYIRSVGGQRGKEVLVAGLKNGQVVKIFLDNPFPVDVVKVPQSVRCVDLNLAHTKIAVVDESSTLFVYDLLSKDLLFQEPSAVSVFWNAYYDDLLSYSGFGVLNIKAGNFPVYQQKMGGFVVGFCGHKIFSMQNSSVVTLEVPLSAPMYQYISHKRFEEAYKVAALGVPMNDWKCLANQALEGMDFAVARKAFSKIKNLTFLRLIEQFQGKVGDEKGRKGFLGEVYAYQGRFNEAARLWKENGEEDKAVGMYADLRMFDLAQEYLKEGEGGSGGKSGLLRRKAEWAQKINEPRAAAEMYLVAGDKEKAIEIMGQNGWTDMLLEVGRKLDRNDAVALGKCAEYLVKLGEASSAAEMYRRVGLVDRVLDLYILDRNWPEVFVIVERHPELKKMAYLPYAQWLAENDRFAESQKAFHEAGCPEEAFKVLEQLIKNAIFETRFHDAGYYHWVLSIQYLDLARSRLGKEGQEEIVEEMMELFYLHQKKGAMYYAFNSVYRYTDQPFTPFMADALFNISKFLMHELMVETDLPISKFHVLYTLAKQARTLKAFKLARNVLERLKGLMVTEPLKDGLCLLSLASRGDKFHDSEELLPMCYRCSTTNPLLNPRGNHCINCFHPFVFSFVSFEVLPVVEFQPEEDISDEEAVGLIGANKQIQQDGASTTDMQSLSRAGSKRGIGGGSVSSGSTTNIMTAQRMRSAAAQKWREDVTGEGVQVLHFAEEDDVDDEDGDGDYGDYGDDFGSSGMLGGGVGVGRGGRRARGLGSPNDPFTYKPTGDSGGVYQPVILDRAYLRTLEPTETIVCKWPAPLRYKFYRNLIPEMNISQCQTCFQLFHTDDFVLQVLQKGHCPFCRSSDAMGGPGGTNSGKKGTSSGPSSGTAESKEDDPF